ncbi:MAG: hypothetical protein IPH49_00910 [Ignavibacteria bacterium]|nr:hypothetical protein [Ignavibacteria bacterium]
MKNKYSDLAVEEAQRAINFIKSDYGIPRENIRTYAKLTAFGMILHSVRTNVTSQTSPSEPITTGHCLAYRKPQPNRASLELRSNI